MKTLYTWNFGGLTHDVTSVIDAINPPPEGKSWKVPAIKMLREITGCRLYQAKQFVEGGWKDECNAPPLRKIRVAVVAGFDSSTGKLCFDSCVEGMEHGEMTAVQTAAMWMIENVGAEPVSAWILETTIAEPVDPLQNPMEIEVQAQSAD